MVLSVTLNLAYMKSVIYVLFSAMFQTVVELMLVVALKEINKTLEVNFSCLDNKDAGRGGGGGGDSNDNGHGNGKVTVT